jgi:phosphatidylglycerol lysyltransferase
MVDDEEPTLGKDAHADPTTSDFDAQAADVAYSVGEESPTSPHSEIEALADTEEQDDETRTRQLWGVRVVAMVTFLSGLVCVVHPLFIRMAAHPKLFTALVPYSVYHWSRSLTSAFGFMLIYLSLNLLKRKRVAWILSFALTVFSLLNLLARIGSERMAWIVDRGQDLTLPVTALVPSVVALIFLWIWRGSFTVRSEPRGIHRAIVFVVLSVGLAFLYGSVGFWLLDKADFGVNFTWSDAMLRTFRELTLQGNNDLIAHTTQGASFLQSLRVFGTLAGVFSLYSIFRPLEYELATLPRERTKAQATLRSYGRSALDEMKLLPDKSYFFGRGEHSFVAYKTVRNIAIVLGDPVGPDDDLPELTERFMSFCHNNGWNLAFMQTTPDFLPMYKKLGLGILKIGEDAVVDIEKFCGSTIKSKTFKAPLRKFDKQGFKLERLAPPHSDAILDAVQTVSQEWLSLPGRKERGFSLGQFDRTALQTHPLFVLQDDKGQIIAFVDQIPSYVKSEVTIDMMRHRKDVPSGTMDYLFGKLLEAFKELGFARFSLGLAALAGVGDKPGSSLEERAAFLMYTHLNRFFSYKGLRAYKQKFDPSWEERFSRLRRRTAGAGSDGCCACRCHEGLNPPDGIELGSSGYV